VEVEVGNNNLRFATVRAFECVCSDTDNINLQLNLTRVHISFHKHKLVSNTSGWGGGANSTMDITNFNLQKRQVRRRGRLV